MVGRCWGVGVEAKKILCPSGQSPDRARKVMPHHVLSTGNMCVCMHVRVGAGGEVTLEATDPYSTSLLLSFVSSPSSPMSPELSDIRSSLASFSEFQGLIR